MLTLGSLFDGIGGFCLAAERHGIKPVWASEIDESCQKVTAIRFPDCQQLGDITKLDGAILPPVDVICFGSPCQGLSIAGLKKGLEDERSGLFRNAIDIIRAMRRATEGRYPRVIVWENVPGAFSSNAGQDFRAVLSEIAETEIPMPSDAKWSTAGMVQCDDRQICWRVLDAQYWGVPQRRKRIFLVASFGTRCAEQILFKQEGLRRHPETFQGERQASAEDAGRCSASADRSNGVAYPIENHPADARFKLKEDGICQTLKANMHGGVLPMVALSVDTYNFTTQEERTHPLRACDCYEPQTVCSPEEQLRNVGGQTECYSIGHDQRAAALVNQKADTLMACDYKQPPIVTDIYAKEEQMLNGGQTV